MADGYFDKNLKPKKCKWCKNSFTPYTSLSQCCGIKCSLAYNNEKKRIKDAKMREVLTEEQINERVKSFKKNIYEVSVFNYLQQEINKIVRLIDMGHPCISSGLPYGKYHPNAGHYFGVGAHPALRYNLLNIFNQSKKDNDELGGKGSTYGLGLKNTFGEDVRNEIEDLVAKYPTLHLSPLEAKEKLSIARKIAKELFVMGVYYTTRDRIDLRKRLNERIGLYL